MMKLTSQLLILSIVFLVFSGCVSKTDIKPPEKIVVEKVYVYEKCYRSYNPSYKKLEQNTHIGSAYNVNILIENLTLMEDYINSLESTVSCYENQSEGNDK